MLSLLNEIETEAPTSPNSREAGSIGVKSAISLSIVEDSFKPIHDGIDIILNANSRIKELINIKRTGLPTQQKSMFLYLSNKIKKVILNIIYI